ncbi:RsmB/NOP family class I SAM-dependent RNA methyltransferase [Sphingomonas sp. ID0503]|uniref:RsmB/NOP family class I SAM-dependent RNA methyltransferase n=1 Tax=Sphingomonas sp. ID0503 TaxID=3399691 RepID=UPI003AFADB91
MPTNKPKRPHRRTPSALPSGVPARGAALRLLDAVLRQGLPLEAALPRATEALERSDRALARNLASGVLRHLTDLDALIDAATARPLAEDAKARMVLRIALYQALGLGTPGHAAIATVLPLVDGGPRRLVHGVFSTVTRANDTLPNPPSLPAEVATRWSTNWGEAVVDAARALLAEPPLDLTLKTPDAPAPEGESLAPGHVRLPGTTPIAELHGYAEGGWWVQDIAASIPARLIGAGKGRVALDLCAAPGGKTMQLAANGWRVTAVDLVESRLRRLSENLVRTNLSADLVTADVMEWQPPAPADAVLIDAPCSATGIFRRHPEVLYRAGPRQIEEAAQLQAKLIARAADWVSPGGLLVYAVCSLEPDEGEAILDGFLATRDDFTIEPPADGELPTGITPLPGGAIRILPGTLAQAGGADGFFIARFRRRR